ncbi:MAG: type II toxin-antitoxin system RatA family toxin [Tropicimonas sp.]|uniref:type II toxin-antitoxin system RatA family toxin n=1 Tax=Tropicimonas sp. TaxID=2067044 RepID=UPI003A85C127
MHRFSDKRVMPYTARQMYDLVADIESYPQFLPWTAAARLRDRRQEGDAVVEIADMVVSFKLFRETFGTKVTLIERERSITSELVNGPFRHLVSKWMFRDVESGCEVDYGIEFEFRNRILQKTAGVFFNEAQRQIMGAFRKRAEALYG